MVGGKWIGPPVYAVHFGFPLEPSKQRTIPSEPARNTKPPAVVGRVGTAPAARRTCDFQRKGVAGAAISTFSDLNMGESCANSANFVTRAGSIEPFSSLSASLASCPNLNSRAEARDTIPFTGTQSQIHGHQ